MLVDERTGLELIPQSMLRKYIQYARDRIHPQLTNMPEDKVAKLYADLRRESVVRSRSLHAPALTTLLLFHCFR